MSNGPGMTRIVGLTDRTSTLWCGTKDVY